MGQLKVIEDRERPFHCGTQAADWSCSNCDRCKKSAQAEEPFRCEIQEAIAEAYMTDGTVSREVAARMGYVDCRQFLWACPEAEWTEEWKAECRRRQTCRYRIAHWIFRTRRAVRRWLAEQMKKARQRRRMPIALKHSDAGTSGCWADWCTWALSMNERPGEDDNAIRCQRDAKENGSCYCGKFQDQAAHQRIAAEIEVMKQTGTVK
jgi:hypothetical protein